MIRFNPITDSKEIVQMDKNGNPVGIVDNPDFIDRTAEQWIKYQIGNLDVKDQYLQFVVDDDPDQDKACLDVTYRKAEPEFTFSTRYTQKAREESIFITYPIHPQQRWQDVPVTLAEGRYTTVAVRNDNERFAFFVLAEIIAKTKPKTLTFETRDGIASINAETLEINPLFGFDDHERDRLHARLCDRVEAARLLAVC